MGGVMEGIGEINGDRDSTGGGEHTMLLTSITPINLIKKKNQSINKQTHLTR